MGQRQTRTVLRAVSFVVVATLVGCLCIAVWLAAIRTDGAAPVDIAQVIEDVRAGRVESITVTEGSPEVVAQYANGRLVRSRIPSDTSIVEVLRGAGIDFADGEPQVIVEQASSWGDWFQELTFVLVVVLPILLLVGVLALGVALGMRLLRR